MKGRLEILVPNAGRTSHHPPGEPCWSMMAKSLDDVERFFKETIENRDEGVVVKDFSSKWEPGDRSGKWLKLKPDYVHPSSDLDVLIIGGYYGSGRLGGEVAQFLVGLAERPASNMFPRRFLSFCRVGTGLTDEERNAVVTKLKPYFRKYKEPPNFYQVTNHSKERPDVWVDSPEKSIVVSITSDIRTISSEVFAAPYSLRFPRIDRVRWDKPWHDCLDVQSFLRLVHASNGTTHGGKDYESQQIKHKRFSQKQKGEKKDFSKVPSHFVRTDISGIKGESKIFANMMFYFANVPSSVSLDTVHKMVVENGGSFSMNLNDLVTHCIAAESKGIRYQAAKQRRDVINSSWFLDCCERNKLLPLQPKYFLFITDSSKRNFQEEVDEFADSYYWVLDISDIKQLLRNVERSENPENIEYYKKIHPLEKWSCFVGCRIYFSSLLETLKPEWSILLSIRQTRLVHEVCWHGGEITDDLVQATHVVVLTIPEFAVDSCSFLKSLTEAEKRILRMKSIPLVDSNWLDGCLESDKKLPEDSYKLKINFMEESTVTECAHEAEHELVPGGSNTGGRQTPSSSLHEEPKTGKVDIGDRGTMDELQLGGTRKRGRTTSGSSSMRGNRALTQTRRAWGRSGKKAAKISQNTMDNSCPDDSSDERVKIQEDNQKHVSESKKLYKNPIHDDVKQDQPSKSGSITELPDNDNLEDDCVDGQEMIEDRKIDRPDFERPDKMEVTADPVQAMLFDMIPSLGMRKVEASEGPSEIKKQIVQVFEPNEEPPKKKKVSYRDVAGELLKDW
ncbi:hypothetical protein MLD38_014541 [Melastoma candidum]|uniref:Uncharacterized protein n=1 Tax=Melastoma candidum TaxID=119954 RepID=A0ACB9REZ8_9MYRT|nr:hypothetical protein MLD38_014541 [Melastoma candidum]